MTTVLLIIHFFIASFLVGVILIQRSEGGALGGLGGGAGGLMSARGTANLLTRATAFLAVAFFVNTLLIAILLRTTEGSAVFDAADSKDDISIEDTLNNDDDSEDEAEETENKS